MIETLKELFGEVTDENLTKFNKSLGERFVAKSDFNSKIEEIKDLKSQISERDKQLEQMKNSANAGDDLKNEIENLKKSFAEKTLSSAIENALLRADAVDTDLVRVKLNMDNIKIDDNGQINGLDEQLPELKKNYAFLFKNDSAADYTPSKGKTPDTAPETLGGAIKEFYNNKN